MSREKTRTRATEKLINRSLREVRTLTIGKVLHVYPDGWVDVDPQIQLVARNPETLEEAPVDIGRLNRVPIGYYKAGGFIVTLPTAIGDEGLLVFSDRSLDVWKTTAQKNPPNSPRLHDFSDAIFVPFPSSNAGAIQNYSTENLVVGKEDQTTQLIIQPDGSVLLKSDNSVTCQTPQAIVESPVITMRGDSGGGDTAVGIAGTLSATGVIHSDSNVEGADFVPSSGPTHNNHGHNPGTYQVSGTPVTGKSDTPS